MFVQFLADSFLLALRRGQRRHGGHQTKRLFFSIRLLLQRIAGPPSEPSDKLTRSGVNPI
jgi:hypothetical protein